MRRIVRLLRSHAAGRSGFTLMELMVVIGIASLLLVISSTAFFGASRDENMSRSRDQLRDLVLTARQNACVQGIPYVVVCYNTTREIKVGNTTEKVDQGRFALFRYAGRVWPSGEALAAPFGFQRDQLSTLNRGERLINLDDPEKQATGGSSQFMRIEAVVNDYSRLESESIDSNNQAVRNLNYTYEVAGTEDTWNMAASGSGGDYGFSVATLESSSGETEPFPVGVRASVTYSLPNGYRFDSNRTAIVFLPDGNARKAASLKALPSKGAAQDAEEFAININTDGKVDVN